MKKKIILINGSPRKKANTATLLHKAAEGAESVGARTDLIHLYDLEYTGCVSCFACKRKDGKYNCRCVVKDDLSPVLKKIMKSDGLILGSPIYLGDVTGKIRCMLERLVFMNLSYDHPGSNFKGRIPVSFIYTMNVDAATLNEWGYPHLFGTHEKYLSLLGGTFEYMTATDTYQFRNYDKYAAGRFDKAHKAKVREKQFPVDCRNAFELGVRMAGATVG
ncbi:MAG: flavodoxin family protein [Bacteroides sp.]|nr:flavodoxin family protein [Bacteroides sp.]